MVIPTPYIEHTEVLREVLVDNSSLCKIEDSIRVICKTNPKKIEIEQSLKIRYSLHLTAKVLN